MPIVVLLDTSFSMNQSVLTQKVGYLNEHLPRINLAQHGLKILFEFLQTNNKFEMTSLLTYSRTCQVVSQFTRDYELLKNCLQKIQTLDKTNLMPALFKVAEILNANYNSDLSYHILIITDGIALLHPNISNKNISSSFENDVFDLDHLSLPDKCKIHLICLTTLNDVSFQKSLQSYREILMKNCQEKPSSIEVNVSYDGGQIWVPDVSSLSYQVIEDLFLKICCDHFKAYSGKIICGNLYGLINLYPNLLLDRVSSKIKENLDMIRICGFLNADEMSDPPVFSRHYVMPMAEKNLNEFKKWISFINLKSDLSDEEIINMFNDESRQPSFSVLLHGSFKIANMVALCEIGTSHQWYGILHSVSDKKKSNLMLYTFIPGLNSVPWIPNFHHLFLTTESTHDRSNLNKNNNVNKFGGKKSPNYFVWLQQQSVQNDVQKVIRLIKKLPDKYDQLLSEINRIQRTATAFRFFELINILIQIFENDARQFPNCTNSEVMVQIDQIIKYLKQTNQQIKS